MQAVQFDHYGGTEVLTVADIDQPEPARDEVLVQVRAAATNPGEAAIREGAMAEAFPATFPSGQGSDFAGVIAAVGPDVHDVDVGDEVIGFSLARSSQAEFVAVPVGQVVPKPPEIDWPAAGSLYVVGATAYAAVRAIDVRPHDVVVVSAAAGGVGSIVVQLLRVRGAEVIGIASAANHAWLKEHGVTPVEYGDGLADRVRTAAGSGVDAFIDTYGPEYVDLALELGVAPDRIETIIAFEAAANIGAKAEGSQSASTPEVLAEMAGLVADGRIEIPVAAVHPFSEVRAAYDELEKRHTHGKIVLVPDS